MIKELMHDPIFLAGKSEVATKENLQVAQDLLDTLMAHKETCVGKAANMIGVRKRIIAFLDESGRAPTYTVMLNPEPIPRKIRKSGTGCVYQINDHLWEGSFYPRLPNGKRKKFNVYAETKERCEIKLAEMIERVKAEIAEEKALRGKATKLVNDACTD